MLPITMVWGLLVPYGDGEYLILVPSIEICKILERMTGIPSIVVVHGEVERRECRSSADTASSSSRESTASLHLFFPSTFCSAVKCSPLAPSIQTSLFLRPVQICLLHLYRLWLRSNPKTHSTIRSRARDTAQNTLVLAIALCLPLRDRRGISEAMI